MKQYHNCIAFHCANEYLILVPTLGTYCQKPLSKQKSLELSRKKNLKCTLLVKMSKDCQTTVPFFLSYMQPCPTKKTSIIRTNFFHCNSEFYILLTNLSDYILTKNQPYIYSHILVSHLTIKLVHRHAVSDLKNFIYYYLRVYSCLVVKK